VSRRRASGPREDETLEAWGRIAKNKKTLLGWPQWPDPEPLEAGASVVTPRADVHTAATETISIVVPLGDASGVGLEGVRLRLNVWAFRRQHEVTATLEVPGGRLFVTIARVDAWPGSPHINVRARKHSGLKHLPALIDGHHCHRFADNVRLGFAAFAPQANLPVAAAIQKQLESFRDFVRVMSSEFRIDGLDDLEPPDSWRGLLL
jgi:hypothetical protein